ncbi:phage exclusion protein Lit family protein [Rhodanobacter sp. C05]|uniref:phage exclusion protein Lit family protein n=1 Tax=Rhodanobacter sp. C05 TaxID=1945855 RepID=UPI00098778AC|nr:phage exclusion protein Lit family protein [Rhodanobacter sp. C05]OOG42678.1 hypothetical protein B0E51_04305 [Rhodanobacter sp. C05]
MRSPILILERAIAGSAFSIAPERGAELAGARDSEGFSLALSDDRHFSIRVNTVTHEATLPIATLEYLWCCAYIFYVMYQEYVKAQSSGMSTLDLASVPRVVRAIRVLNWAARNMRESGVRKWPMAAPRPKKYPKYASDAHVANEIFLAAIAWIIHHEIAHVRLQHIKMHAIYTIQQEREADLAATDWILHSPRNADEAQKRQLGMVTAILAMQLLDEPKGDNSYVSSHPAAAERLDYVLDRAKVADDSVVCGFAAATMQYHLTQLGIKQELDGTSIRDILAGFMLAFTTAGRARA